MKCRSCQAESEADAVSCWACGVRLQRPPDGQRPLAMRPDAMRHYSTASAAIATHQPWLDGLVLISTILFGLLLGSFVVGVLPASGSPGGLTASLRRLANPLALLTPLPQVLPLEAAGVAQASRGFVAQIVQPYRSPAEGGITAGPGTEFLVVTAVIDNQTGQPLTYSLKDWQVRDSRGRVRAAEPLRGDGWLSGGSVAPGRMVQGFVAFVIPKGEAHTQISFSAAALRAVMRWDATPPAA